MNVKRNNFLDFDDDVYKNENNLDEDETLDDDSTSDVELISTSFNKKIDYQMKKKTW